MESIQLEVSPVVHFPQRTKIPLMRKKHEHSVGARETARLSEETERNIDFYYHSVESHIESLAEQAGDKTLVPAIASRLVRLLEAKTLWESFRATQSVPEMWPDRNGDRGTGQARNTAWVREEADLSRDSSRGRTLSKKARKAISEGQRVRWAAYHAKKDADRERWRKAKQSERSKAKPQGLTARGTPRKVNLTPAQLAAMRANAQKGRAVKGKHRKPMSAERRAEISAARKAWWAAQKKAGAA